MSVLAEIFFKWLGKESLDHIKKLLFFSKDLETHFLRSISDALAADPKLNELCDGTPCVNKSVLESIPFNALLDSWRRNDHKGLARLLASSGVPLLPGYGGPERDIDSLLRCVCQQVIHDVLERITRDPKVRGEAILSCQRLDASDHTELLRAIQQEGEMTRAEIRTNLLAAPSPKVIECEGTSGEASPSGLLQERHLAERARALGEELREELDHRGEDL